MNFLHTKNLSKSRFTGKKNICFQPIKSHDEVFVLFQRKVLLCLKISSRKIFPSKNVSLKTPVIVHDRWKIMTTRKNSRCGSLIPINLKPLKPAIPVALKKWYKFLGFLGTPYKGRFFLTKNQRHLPPIKPLLNGLIKPSQHQVLELQKIEGIFQRGKKCGKRVHPRKLTWNLKMSPWKRRFLLKTIILPGIY